MAAPTVTSFTPHIGWTGTTVSITGTHLTGTTKVEIYDAGIPGGPEWAMDAYSFTVDSDTQITAVCPHFDTPNIPGSPGAFSRWRVTTPDGTANKGDFWFYGPVWESITITPDPASVPADGSLQLTATGHYLYDGDVDLTIDVGWESDDIAVAMVNNGIWTGGLTFGRAPGTATITATIPERGYPEQLHDPGPYVTGTVTLTVDAPPPAPPAPEGRFHLAFDAPSLEAYPAWTRLDDHPNLVTSYIIDRGRTYELDRTDTGRATVQVADTTGILDPTNPDGPYYGKIVPRMQAALCRHNPLTDEWEWRYRGFVDDLDYIIDPSQQVNRLTIQLVDLFEILAGADMQPGLFGDPPPTDSTGQIFFDADQLVEDRIAGVLASTGLTAPFRVVLTGSVTLHHAVYSPGESPLAVVQEAADADFPGANVYCDRQGRICFHGRLAKFYPDEVSASWGPGAWDYHAWQAGDGAAVALSPTDTVQVREFGFQRGLAKIINSASATPVGIDDSDIAGQLVIDPVSIASYGPRSWSADNLLTKTSLLDSSDDLTETKRFATFQVANYGQPFDRVTTVGFRSLHPTDPRAPALYEFLGKVDISDQVTVTVSSPGGGGFTNTDYFVEGIHEDVRPLTPDYDDVTVRLDLSPRALYATNPWPDA